MIGVACAPARGHGSLPRLLVLGLRGPGDVVDRAGPLQRTLGRSRIVEVQAAAAVTAHFVGVLVLGLEAQRLLQQRPAARSSWSVYARTA